MREKKITIDIIDNGYLMYYYEWNEGKDQWDELTVKCCQDKVVLMDMLNEYLPVGLLKSDG